MHCPCGTAKDYLDCCGIFISGQQSAPTPEALMRSRYSGYALGNIEYIAKTMKSPASDNFDIEATRAWAQKIVWTQLEIIKATNNFVEFIAHYYSDNKKYILHEISEFKFENGKWYYIDGIQPNKKSSTDSAKKIGRNNLCPCGSNKKYKKCCG